MSKNKKNPMEVYADEVRSGKFPETHPESKANNGGKDIYPQPEREAPDLPSMRPEKPSFYQKHKDTIKQLAITVIIAAALGAIGYYAYQKYTSGEIPGSRQSLFGDVEETYVTEQQAALAGLDEELASRERVIMAVVDKFFSESSFKGRRKLCISFKAGPTHCTTGDIDKEEFLSNIRH